jgi:hypothetical protein
MSDDPVDSQNIGILLMHIKEVDGMGSLMTIEDALFDYGHFEPTFPRYDRFVAHFGHLRPRTQWDRYAARPGNAIACGFCGSAMVAR